MEPIGAISLQGYCAGIINECLFGQEHLFRLVGYKTTRCRYLAAIDHPTAMEWVKALNQNSIQYSNVSETSHLIEKKRILKLRGKKILFSDHCEQSDAFIENTLHNIHRSPLNFFNPDCNGFLMKFNRTQKLWKRRFFVLKDACLYFYADSSSSIALGSISKINKTLEIHSQSNSLYFAANFLIFSSKHE